MISIRTELDRGEELDRVEQLKSQIAQDYAWAIRSVADYAVEIGPERATEFRKHLLTLHRHAESATTLEDYRQLRRSFRGELREYRDQSAAELSRLREELASAAAALESVAESVSVTGTGVEAQVNSEIRRLEETAATDDLSTIRTGIHEATSSLRETYRQLQRSNQLLVAQLQDEIRSLHKEMADERRALYTDPSSGAWNRWKLDRRIEELLTRPDAFWAVFIRLRMPALDERTSTSIRNGALRALVDRLEGMLGPDVLIGRWTEDMFAAIIESEPAGEREICDAIRAKLSGGYTVQEAGVSHTVLLETSVTHVPRAHDASAVGYYLQVGQLIEKWGQAFRLPPAF